MTDHLGSTVALADTNGTITSSTSYDSFGNATSNIPTSYQYTGREYDADIGLYYYRNRWYDPEVGRFISEDPIGFAGGDINLYGYVGNNPQNFVDPSGNYQCRPRKGSQDKNFEDFLNKDISENCKNALKSIPRLWKEVLKAAKEKSIYDVDKIQNEKASKYFGRKGKKGQTVGEYFDSRGGDAYAYKGSGKEGIYARGGAKGMTDYLRLHETVHMAQKIPKGKHTNLDKALVKDLSIKKKSGQSFSDAVSDYFNSMCDPSLLSK